MFDPSTGEFEDTHYCEDGLFVNSGDLLQQWTGDKLFAAVSNYHSYRTNEIFIPLSTTLIDKGISILVDYNAQCVRTQYV